MAAVAVSLLGDLALATLLWGCPTSVGSGNPVGNRPGSVERTVSGRVYDDLTGTGLSGSRFTVDTLAVTMDVSGHFSFNWHGATKPVGFAVWHGVDHFFYVFDKVAIDAGNSPVFDVGLEPSSDLGYATYSISDRLPPAVALGGSIYLMVRNSAGG